MQQHDFLFELGVEELPAAALPKLSAALRHNMEQALAEARLAFRDTRSFATPRRLALWVRGLATQQEDRERQITGPTRRAAFDEQGKATPAALGFARKHGVQPEDLLIERVGKEERLLLRTREAGRSAAQLLPDVAVQSVARLPLGRTMRWGAGTEEFLRPVRWVLLLLDETPLSGAILGVPAGRCSYGHPQHHPQALEIPHAKRYAALLKSPGRVIADFDARRDHIRKQITALLPEEELCADLDAALLDEITSLTEWPVALRASFPERFLRLPPEVIVCCLKRHQKFVPVCDRQQRLQAQFLSVANLKSRQPERIVRGAERVVRPRLADAEFFFRRDSEQSLRQWGVQLADTVFHAQLGSLEDKCQRLQKLARLLARQLGADEEAAGQAAQLSKADLATGMVQEFPELQGVMGGHYARREGLPEAVAGAIAEQYLPRGEQLPQSDTGAVLALADRLDTLVGILAVEGAPSGAGDPFALRRAALGIVRIARARGYDLELRQWCTTALSLYPPALQKGDMAGKAAHFCMERLRHLYLEENTPAALIAAVLERAPAHPADVQRRVTALEEFFPQAACAALAGANKRVANILARELQGEAPAFAEQWLREDAERLLAEELKKRREGVEDAARQADYREVLRLLAPLREPLDRFFDEVRVLAEDEQLRRNRIALLAELRRLFLTVADFSLLAGETASSART